MLAKDWVKETIQMLDRYEARLEKTSFVLPLKFPEKCDECSKNIKAKTEALGIQSEIGTRRYYCSDPCFLKHV